jgi:hypothetical protein
MPQHDQFNRQALAVCDDLLNCISAGQMTQSGNATSLQPPNGFVQHFLMDAGLIIDETWIADRTGQQVRVGYTGWNDRQHVNLSLQQDGEICTAPQSPASNVGTVVTKEHAFKHRNDEYI